MKRYRLANFFLDGTRVVFKDPDRHPDFAQREREQIRSWLSKKHGESDLEGKVKRYLEFDPPNVCVMVEYYYLLLEVAEAYVCGQYYPALTGACCLGERILNELVLRLREHYKADSLYKKVHGKESIQDWDLAIHVLEQWGIICRDAARDYRQLARLRHASVHFKGLPDPRNSALTALKYAMGITGRLFGVESRQDIFFSAPGEIYIQKEKESLPIVREFFIPRCVPVGYMHSVRGDDKGGRLSLIYEDRHEYDDREISDDEFRRLRTEWRASASGESRTGGG